MTILKMFAEKRNFLLISILIILILSFSSVCLGADYNPIPLNKSILESYFNEWWTNSTASNKIPRTQANYDILKDELDSSAGVFFWINGSGYEYMAFLSSSATLILDSGYLKNVNCYRPNGNSMYYDTAARKQFNYTNWNYLTTCNVYDYSTTGSKRLSANTQRGNIVTIIQNVNINWVLNDSINSSTPNLVELGNTSYTTYENVIFKLYKGDSLNSGDVPIYIGDLTSTYQDGYYIIFSDKSLFNVSSDYLIYMTLSNGVTLKSDYAYIVVESSSGGGGSGGTIVVPSGDSGQITTPSGENGGNVDLTGVQNRLDGVNQNLGVINDSIKAVPGEVAKEFYDSGDTSGDKGIVQKIYDDLFTVDDEFIKNKVDELGEEMGISGEYLKESTEMILSVYDETQKGDFIISWAPFYFEEVLLIPSGDVNFSKIERDVPAVQDLMFWVRIILSFSCFGLILRQIWFLILSTLGVTTSIYEDYVEEENALIGQTYETTSVSNVQDGVRTTISHRRRLGK